MITARHFTDPKKFWESGGDWLCHAEAENNHILGSLEQGPDETQQDLWLLKRQDDVCGAAIHARNALAITRLSAASCGPLIEAMRAQRVELDRVVGPAPGVDCFAKRWRSDAVLQQRQQLYLCTQPIHRPDLAPGQLILARRSEWPALIEHVKDFMTDAGLKVPAKGVDVLVGGYLAHDSLYVWRHQGRVCAIIALAGRTSRGVRIDILFTLRGARRRGYGAATVAAITRDVLRGQCQFCVVYADLESTAPNRLYRSLGFSPLCENHVWVFATKAAKAEVR